ASKPIGMLAFLICHLNFFVSPQILSWSFTDVNIGINESTPLSNKEKGAHNIFHKLHFKCSRYIIFVEDFVDVYADLTVGFVDELLVRLSLQQFQKFVLAVALRTVD